MRWSNTWAAPIDLVGHSMGGTVACLYAGTRPESCAAPRIGGRAWGRRMLPIGPSIAHAGSSRRPSETALHDTPPLGIVSRRASQSMRKYNPNISPEDVAFLTLAARRATRPVANGYDLDLGLYLHRSPFARSRFRRLSSCVLPTQHLGANAAHQGWQRRRFELHDELDARARCIAHRREVIIATSRPPYSPRRAPQELGELIAGPLSSDRRPR